MKIHFHALPADQVTAIRDTGRDAYDQPVEVQSSDGEGVPCRHCLKYVPAGRNYLVLAHRPFESRNPYAETGPIFLCADPCEAAVPREALPEILGSPHYLLRGYTPDERILYGTGQISARGDLASYAARLLDNLQIAFVDVRSASNNCFQCRVRRAS